MTSNKETSNKGGRLSAGIASDPNGYQVEYHDRSASVLFFDGKTSMASENSFAGSSFDDMSAPHYQGQRKMTNPNVKFVDKNKWKNNPNCSVCEVKLDKIKGVNTHHCRLCASAVCGPCSHRKINEERVCDLCFMRQKTGYQQKSREDFLASKIEKIKQTENFLQKKKEEFVEAKSRLTKVQNEVDNSDGNQNSGIGVFQNHQEEENLALKKKKEANEQLRQDIDKVKQAARDREETLRNIKTKISVLKLQISQKKAMIDDKTEQLDSLKTQTKALEYRQAQQNESVVENQPEASSIGRNYSLSSKSKDGKYNISFQPVNI